jgi:hypothetical protein
MFIGPDEIAYREREGCILGHRERIYAEIVFKPRYQDGEAERIEPGFMKTQIIVERWQGDPLLGRDLLHCREDF